MEQYQPLWSEACVNASALRAIDNARTDPKLSPHKEFGDRKRTQVTFKIPKFQRGLRWKDSKRKAFADSMRQGRPIGTLTFSLDTEDSEEDEKTYFVLDGQQRIAAVSLIIEGFWKDEHWRLAGHAEQDAIKKLDGFLGADATSRALKDLLTDEKQEHLELLDGQFLTRLSTLCERDLPDHGGTKFEYLLRATNKLREALQGQLKGLESYPVSAHIIDPGEGLTPSEERQLITDVFVNLNSNMKLSKNELLAAEWEQVTILWPPKNPREKDSTKRWNSRNDELFNKMKERIETSYKELEEEFEYDPDVEVVTKENVSLYDWLHALSVTTNRSADYKSNSYLAAFNETSKLEELAFDTLSLLITGSNTPNSKSFREAFEDHFVGGGEGKFQVNKFQHAYFEAAEAINKALSPIKEYVGNSNRKEPLGKIAATTYLAYYIALTRNTFHWDKASEPNDAGTADGRTNSQRQKDFLMHLKGWWILDVLQDTFIGSEANQLAHERVWVEFDRKNKIHTLNTTMLDPIDIELLAARFVAIFTEEWTEPIKSPGRRNWSKAAKVVTMTCFSTEKLEDELELDHLVAWKNGEGGRPPDKPLPLNHVANYAPISDTINRKRQNTPWAEYFPTLSPPDQKKIEGRLIISPDEFSPEARSEIETFQNLLHKRWILMVFKTFNAIGNPEWDKKERAEQAEFLYNKVSEPIRKLQRLYSFRFTEMEIFSLIQDL
jgi:hypothetical protein